MTQQTISTGAAPNDGNGDPLRSAFTKANDNFTELYTDKIAATDIEARVGIQTVSDARILEDLVISNGSPIVTSATANFQDADIGKTIAVVDGAGVNLKAITTIASRQSTTQVTLAINMLTTGTKGATFGTNDAPAIQSALNALSQNTRIALRGHILIASAITSDFLDRITHLGLDLGEATLHIAVPATDKAIELTNIESLQIDGGVFVGTPNEYVDAKQTLRVTECSNLTIEKTHFVGLANLTGAGGGTEEGPSIVTFARCHAWLYGVKFGGCFCNSGNNSSNIENWQWQSFQAENCQFFDFGKMNEFYFAKGLAATLAWVRMNTQVADPTPNSAINFAGARFTNCYFDEGAFYAIYAQPSSGNIEYISIDNCQNNVTSIPGGAAYKFADLYRADVSRCYTGLSSVAIDAINAAFVTELNVRNCDFTANCDRITLGASVTNFLLENTAVASIVGTATNSLIIRDQKGASVYTKAGAISDADFPTAPASGTIGIDTTNGRLYYRSGSTWRYVNFDV